jgi:hypothetical protein
MRKTLPRCYLGVYRLISSSELSALDWLHAILEKSQGVLTEPPGNALNTL